MGGRHTLKRRLGPLRVADEAHGLQGRIDLKAEDPRLVHPVSDGEANETRVMAELVGIRT